MAESMRSRYKEHAGEERALHGYKKPKNAKKSFEKFKEKKESTPKKMKKVMTEFKEGKLHSGSKRGPKVTNPKQAVAIAYSEARKVKKDVKKRGKIARKARAALKK